MPTTPIALTSDEEDFSLTAEDEAISAAVAYTIAANRRFTRAGNRRVTRGGNVRVTRGAAVGNPIKLTASQEDLDLTSEA